MAELARRDWVPTACEDYVQALAEKTRALNGPETARWIEDLVAENHAIHERDCVNLNPATNIMNPAAEALLARGLGSRPSLGYPGDKYEMGLEAIEKIEVVAAELAAEIFRARFAEVRVASMHGKTRRQGRYSGRQPDWKKAYVRLADGEKPIEFFEGV